MRNPAMLILSAALAIAPPSDAAPERPQRVLLLYSYAREFAPFGAMAQEFRAELARRSPRPVEFLDASLEMARFDGAEKDEPLTQFLSAIYRDGPPDLVTPFGAPAAGFLHRNRARLFKQTPVLLVGADRRRTGDLALDERMAFVTLKMDLARLAADLSLLLPDLRRLYIVGGTDPLEQFWESELKREWPPHLPGVELCWMSHLPLEEIKQAVASAPRHSAVFCSIMNRDAAGVPHEDEDALRELRAVASAPVFGYSMEQLGQGIVGGCLVSLKECGKRAADAALRLLSSEAVTRVATPLVRPGAPVFDWRELKRWGIPESRLPAGATVMFREPGLWETHRTAVLITLGVLLVQSGLIALLFAAHRRARESESSLRLTAEAANVGLWEHDVGAPEPITATTEWRGLFGLPATGRLKLEDVIARLHLEDAPMVQEAIEHAARTGEGYAIEHRIVLPGGGVRWIASLGRAERRSEGRPPRTRGVALDITERRVAMLERDQHRRELAHLARVTSLGELSGTLAHELNQPLGSILSNAQAAQRLLNRDATDLAEVREILADIISEDLRAGDVIKRLRALLQRGETLMRPMHVRECIEEVLELLRAELIARNVSVARSLERDLPQIMADRVQIQQVLLNLFSNACDAMDGQPADARLLTVRTFREKGYIHIEVRDTGTGIQGPVEDLFQPFHTTKSQGLGMGLAICRTITEAHRGRLWAEPCQKGGAVFHLVLPLPASP